MCSNRLPSPANTQQKITNNVSKERAAAADGVSHNNNQKAGCPIAEYEKKKKKNRAKGNNIS